MKLTKRHKLDFIRNGYLKIPGVVSREKISRALRVINRHLAEKPRADETPDRVPFFSELFQSPELMGLILETPLWAVVESLLGPGRADRPQAEVTLGFPNADEHVPFNGKELHIDGFPDKGRQETFTLNVGVFLSDAREPFSGNFKVFPGSHVLVAEHARRHGHCGINKSLRDLRAPEEEKQILVKAGDAVVCHYNLVHAREWNSTPRIRYAVFFRVYAAGHLDRWREALRDLWLEWDGLKDLTAGDPRR
ncbi:MAG: hypothetical protein HKL90_01060 [Elusimicrobia bacterium]|nr:hypothetical protein [Elusimicrobiota bacterium]